MDFREAVRKRPGMYMGGSDGHAVAQMVLEVLSNSVDQHLVGQCQRVDISVGPDGTVTIDDDGPGIRTGAVDGMLALFERLTTLHHSPTADGHRPHVHVGLLGVGLAAVNALSDRFEVVTVRDGVETSIAFERGVLVAPLRERTVDRPSGTRIVFRADAEVFGEAHPFVPRLTSRLDELSYVAPRLAISFSTAGVVRAGMAARVEQLGRRLLGPVAHHRGRFGDEEYPTDVELALGWREHDADGAEAAVLSFVNFERTTDHGQHVLGLEDGIQQFFERASWRACSHGLVAIVSVLRADVLFGAPTRTRLETRECRPAVAQATRAALTAWEAAAPAAAKTLRQRIARRAP